MTVQLGALARALLSPSPTAEVLAVEESAFAQTGEAYWDLNNCATAELSFRLSVQSVRGCEEGGRGLRCSSRSRVAAK